VEYWHYYYETVFFANNADLCGYNSQTVNTCSPNTWMALPPGGIDTSNSLNSNYKCDSYNNKLKLQTAGTHCKWRSEPQPFSQLALFNSIRFKFDLMAKDTGGAWEYQTMENNDYAKIAARTCSTADVTSCSGAFKSIHVHRDSVFDGIFESDDMNSFITGNHGAQGTFLQVNHWYVQLQVELKNDESDEVHQMDNLRIEGVC